MPKLSHPLLIKGKAISYLVEYYRADSLFMKELEAIRYPYITAIQEFAKAMSEFWRIGGAVLSKQDYWLTIEALFQGKQNISIPTELRSQLNMVETMVKKLEPYIKEINDLAFKWKLRIPLATQVLLMYDVSDVYIVSGINREIEVPLESLGYLYPWAPPLPDLVIRIPAWALFLSGREQIEKEISGKLSQYEEQLKSAGYHEFPSALKNHARWWFLHYVKKNTYDQIAGMEALIPGGNPMVYGRNVGVAVRRFSRLIDINLKNLK